MITTTTSSYLTGSSYLNKYPRASTLPALMDALLNQTTVPLLQLLRETLYPAAPHRICYKTIPEEVKNMILEPDVRYFYYRPKTLVIWVVSRVLCLLYSCNFQLQYLSIVETAPNIIWPSNFCISLSQSHLSLEQLNWKQRCTQQVITELDSSIFWDKSIKKNFQNTREYFTYPRNLESTN